MKKKTIKAWASRCAYLNEDGRQCRNEGTKKMNYHGDTEVYRFITCCSENIPTWVRIYLCQKHYDATK